MTKISFSIRLLFLLLLSLIVAAPAFAHMVARDSLSMKIGQMIMIGINGRTSIDDTDRLLSQIRQQQLGGVVLFEKNIAKTNSADSLKAMISKMQQAARIPLLITIDEEGGKVHRLKEKYGFVGMPSATYLGQLNNADSTLYYNRRLAAELAELGINFNYAPSLDLAINPENTVIVKRERSFSAQPELVSKHALLCIKAHHENGIKTILKHFPGHGSSTADSHYGIVDVSNTWDFSELFPYYTVLKSGQADAIMTAHIINKSWDSSLLPATLSKKVIDGMLRGLLGYKGVVFSDDMQMQAISKQYGLDKALELAVNAGVDVLMFGNNVSATDQPVSAAEIHSRLLQLVYSGKISRSRINQSYERIMLLKNKQLNP